jgi:hypothetical protein
MQPGYLEESITLRKRVYKKEYSKREKWRMQEVFYDGIC